MQCPAGCEATLVMSERQGVEIDYCPTCRGVWLDRGELDKIIERDNAALEAAASGAATAPNPPPQPPPQPQPQPQPQAAPPPPQVHTYQAPYPGSPKYGYGYGRRKKRGFLGDLFDF